LRFRRPANGLRRGDSAESRPARDHGPYDRHGPRTRYNRPPRPCATDAAV